MDTTDDALIGPNPRDELIKEIAKANKQQAIADQKRKIEWQKTLLEMTTTDLAKKYFGLKSIEFFDSKKIEDLQGLIYEKAKRANIRHKVILVLIPVIGWILLALHYDDYFAFRAHIFVKYYKKFRKKEESKK